MALEESSIQLGILKLLHPTFFIPGLSSLSQLWEQHFEEMGRGLD